MHTQTGNVLVKHSFQRIGLKRSNNEIRHALFHTHFALRSSLRDFVPCVLGRILGMSTGIKEPVID